MRLIAAALFCCVVGSSEGLGSRASELSLEALDGSKAAISASRAKATVVAFISTLCPISNSFNERMTALYNGYSARGVQFVFVNSNANESSNDVAAHIKSAGFPFVVYRDPSNRMADLLGAKATPETYVLDHDGIVRYHGYIEDSPNEARSKKKALRGAVDAVLAGSPVTPAETKAFGCTIKRAHRPPELEK